MPRWASIAIRAGKSWSEDNAFKHSASVSFYTLFSLAPITLVAVWLAGVVFGQEAAQGQLSDQIAGLVGPDSAKVIQQAVAAAEPDEKGSWWAMIAGVVVLLIGATTVFGQLQESLNEIWSVQSRPSRNGIVVLLVRRLVSFAMVLTVGFLLLVSLVLTTAISSFVKLAEGYWTIAPQVLKAVDFVVALGVVTVLFALMYKLLPDVRLRWRDVWGSAAITALLFGVGRLGISFYLAHSSVASTYGAAGSLVALLIWVYYSCAIFFFGVELTRAATEARGNDIQPKPTAVRVRRVIEETDQRGPDTASREE
jgi:Predicted membrane protein